MKEAFSLFILVMLIILGISALIGAFMFVVDIWKWSKHPNRIVTIDKDLSENKESEVVKNE